MNKRIKSIGYAITVLSVVLIGVDILVGVNFLYKTSPLSKIPVVKRLLSKSSKK